jgi:hypothetical protein
MILGAATILAGLTAMLPAQAQTFTFQTIKDTAAFATEAYGFGPSGGTVGYDISRTGKTTGFVASGKTFKAIKAPGATSTLVFSYTQGDYLMQSQNRQGVGPGYIEDATGHFTEIAPPGSVGTKPLAMNASGLLVGSYLPIVNDVVQEIGFTLQNGVYSTFTVPGSYETEINGVNDAGTMVGAYGVENQGIFGFILSGGKMTTVQYPGAVETYLEGINNKGQMVGYYTTLNGTGLIDFIYDGKNFTSFLPTGMKSAWAWNINDAGQVVGFGFTNGNQEVGYVGTPVASAPK